MTTCLPPGRRTIDVGAEAAVLGGGDALLVEVAVGEHAGDLDDAAELDLAPAAAHRRRAQRLDQVAGLGLEAGAAYAASDFTCSLERGVLRRCAASRPRRAWRRRVAADVADRLDEVGDRLLARLELAGGALLELAQRGPGQIEKRLTVALQRLGRQRREGLAQLLLGVAEQADLLLPPPSARAAASAIRRACRVAQAHSVASRSRAPLVRARRRAQPRAPSLAVDRSSQSRSRRRLARARADQPSESATPASPARPEPLQRSARSGRAAGIERQTSASARRLPPSPRRDTEASVQPPSDLLWCD